MWDVAKAVFRGKFIVLNAYVRKEARSKINNLSFHLRKLEIEKQLKTKAKRRNEIIKIQADINEIGNKKAMEKINRNKSWFFGKINNIHKSLARLTKKKRDELSVSAMKVETSPQTPRTLRDHEGAL